MKSFLNKNVKKKFDLKLKNIISFKIFYTSIKFNQIQSNKHVENSNNCKPNNHPLERKMRTGAFFKKHGWKMIYAAAFGLSGLAGVGVVFAGKGMKSIWNNYRSKNSLGTHTLSKKEIIKKQLQEPKPKIEPKLIKKYTGIQLEHDI